MHMYVYKIREFAPAEGVQSALANPSRACSGALRCSTTQLLWNVKSQIR